LTRKLSVSLQRRAASAGYRTEKAILILRGENAFIQSKPQHLNNLPYLTLPKDLSIILDGTATTLYQTTVGYYTNIRC
jgi:hypothetical protein